MNTYFPARLTLFSAVHCLVDLASTFLVFTFLWDGPFEFVAFVLFYFCAFAGQMPIGALADRLNKNAVVASLGCLFLIIAFIIVILFGYQSVLIAAFVGGLGNGLFHVGGGLDVLNDGGKKSGPLGIFVCPGAVGLFIGGYLVDAKISAVLPICIALAIAAIGIIALQRKSFHSLQSQNVPFSLKLTLPQSAKKWATLAISCLFVVVAIRSFVGLTLQFDWKSHWYWGVITLAALVLGKASGGLLSDRFGMKRTAMISLMTAAVLFMFPNIPICGVLAIFLFNMTMPMTLWALSQIFNNAKGFAFGTLTLAIFLGFLITLIAPTLWLPSGWGFAIAALLSLVLLLVGIAPLGNEKGQA